MIQTSVNIILHEKQRVIHDSTAKHKVVKAGKRFGKTRWAIYEVVRAAGLNPNKKIWYIAPTYRQAKQIAWDNLNYILPKSWVKRSVENELYKELVQGAKIQLIGAENEDALRGTDLFALVMDEAAYIKEDVWGSILSGQLLNAGPGSFAYFISSPNKTGRNWFTNFHAEAAKKQAAGNKEWAAFYFTIYDNPTLNREEIEKIKEQNTDDRWSLEYMAQESDYAGILISEFSWNAHVGEHKFERRTTLVRGVDWGLDHPTTCLWIEVDVEGKFVYVRDEFVKSGYLIEESCKVINSRTGRDLVEWTAIDPSTAKRNSQTGRTDKDEFARHGVPCIAGDNNDRGIEIMKMFFKKNMIKIHPRCRNLINEIRTYQRGDKTGDDCLDPLRYVLVRVHDYMLGGKNVFDDDANYVPPADNKKYSLFDPVLFPKQESSVDNQSWIMEEI